MCVFGVSGLFEYQKGLYLSIRLRKMFLYDEIYIFLVKHRHSSCNNIQCSNLLVNKFVRKILKIKMSKNVLVNVL